MKVHANAALGPKGRLTMVLRVLERGWSVAEAAAAAGVSGRTCSKWVARYRGEGEAGLVDRSSAPKAVANRTDERVIAVIAALRRIRFTGPEIAELLGRPLSTVSGILARIGMGKLGRLGLEPAQRYERQRPGELVHVDVKKLRPDRARRGAPGDRPSSLQAHAHRCGGPPARDDRLGIRPRRHRRLHPPGLRRGSGRREDHHRDRLSQARRGILRRLWHPVERLLTDDGSAYRSTVHAIACRALGIRHLRTRPRRPQTNGKAERFIRTLLAGWAYGAIYRTSTERTAALDGWLFHYG
jgi:transposase